MKVNRSKCCLVQEGDTNIVCHPKHQPQAVTRDMKCTLDEKRRPAVALARGVHFFTLILTMMLPVWYLVVLVSFYRPSDRTSGSLSPTVKWNSLERNGEGIKLLRDFHSLLFFNSDISELHLLSWIADSFLVSSRFTFRCSSFETVKIF